MDGMRGMGRGMRDWDWDHHWDIMKRWDRD